MVTVKPTVQPKLSDVLGDENPLTGEPWRFWTVAFWEQLAHFPSTKNHLPAQWSSLARAMAFEEAALLGHAPAAEGRLRVAKHGVDPDDLMRLRILMVEADVAEAKAPAKKTAAAKKAAAKKKTDPRGFLTAVS